MGEEAEMMGFGPVECSVKSVEDKNSEKFVPFEHIADLHSENGITPYGFLKSDMIDRKLNKFTVSRAGDGNIRIGDIVFDEKCIDQTKESIVRSFRITILSGGLKDQISVTFLPKLEQNIHISKPPEEAPKGGVVFHFKKQVASWQSDQRKMTQLLPLIGTNDKLLFVLTSARKVHEFDTRYICSTMKFSWSHRRLI